MAESEDDVLDKLMPDPEVEGGTDQELEIEIVQGEVDGGVKAPEQEDEGAEAEDTGAHAAPDDTDSELDPDDKKQSKSVQERIKREIRLRRRQVASERTAREAAEARALAAESGMVDARILAVTAYGDRLQMEIASLQGEITKAKEGGKTEDEVKLQTKLNDAQANLREANAKKGELEEQKKHPSARVDENQYASQWLGSNTWFSDPEFAGDAAHVRAIDAKLLKSGKFNPKSPEYFQELDRLVHDELPKLRKRVKDQGFNMSFREQRRDPPDTRGVQKRSPAAPAGERQANAAPPQSKTKVTLGKADLENMQRFKLDPTNPKHLQQYAREKLAGGE